MHAKQLFVLVVVALATQQTHCQVNQQVCTSFVPPAGRHTYFSPLIIISKSQQTAPIQALPTRIPWHSSVVRHGCWIVCVASTPRNFKTMYHRVTTSSSPCSTWHVHCPVVHALPAPKRIPTCTSFWHHPHKQSHLSNSPIAPTWSWLATLAMHAARPATPIR